MEAFSVAKKKKWKNKSVPFFFYGSCARETFGSAGYSFPVRQPAYNCHPISFGDDLLAVSAN